MISPDLAFVRLETRCFVESREEKGRREQKSQGGKSCLFLEDSRFREWLIQTAVQPSTAPTAQGRGAACPLWVVALICKFSRLSLGPVSAVT